MVGYMFRISLPQQKDDNAVLNYGTNNAVQYSSVHNYM